MMKTDNEADSTQGKTFSIEEFKSVKKRVETFINHMFAYLIIILLCISGCAPHASGGPVWSYGNFCGEKYPETNSFGHIENLIELENTNILHNDDIDLACKYHDICYEKHGRDYFLCDGMLDIQTKNLVFSGAEKFFCDNIILQIKYYFTGFHKTRYLGRWKTIFHNVPFMVAATPFVLISSAGGFPENSCKSSAPLLNHYYENNHTKSNNIADNPFVIIKGRSKKDISEMITNSFKYNDYLSVNIANDNINVLVNFDDETSERLEKGQERPVCKINFKIAKYKDSSVKIMLSDVIIVVNQNTGYEFIFHIDINNEKYKIVIQQLLDFFEKININDKI